MPNDPNLWGPEGAPTAAKVAHAYQTGPASAWYVDVSPGDGTRYQLVVVADTPSRGGFIVVWEDVKATWWASEWSGGELRLLSSASPRHQSSAGRGYDAAAIGAILDGTGIRS